MTNQPFNPEEWLNTKKKGISGKVPRADFIAKMKELGTEIEQLKQAKIQLETQLNTSLNKSEKQLSESKEKEQELTTKHQEQVKEIENLKLGWNKLEEKNNSLLENIKKLEAKTEAQYKTIEGLENEVKNQEGLLKGLPKRPDNLPDDWEQQLSDKKELEEKNKEMESQLQAVYYTYPIILEEEKPENVKKYISELSKRIEELENRPTTEQLQQAIQQEADKYKDYESIKEEQKKLNQQLQTETKLLEAQKEKNRVLEEELTNLSPPIAELGKDKEEIIKKVGELLNSTINPLKLEIAELLKKQSLNNSQPSNYPTELPSDYEKIKAERDEFFRILEIIKLKIVEEEEKIN